MPRPRVLVVDDDQLVRAGCQRVLAGTCDLRLAENGRDGLAILAEGGLDLALVDLRLPDMDGMDLLRAAPDRFPDVPIVIITGHSTVKSAVEAVKLGAFDYLAKPFTPDELEAVVEKALRHRRLLAGYRELEAAVGDRGQVARLIGQSPAMRRVVALVEQVARTDSTVLISGESGTGKDLVARAIHFLSARKDSRFVAVDCGAIAPSLMASELFGHSRGAFTGATSDRHGLLQAANGGTLFLDEIGNLNLELQPNLLRAIESREVRAVGAAESVRLDIRYIAATNQNLAGLVADGRFREDLYYRLNVFPIAVPPLRERPEDIPVLARHFLALCSRRMHKRIEDFTPEAARALQEYAWPGNVRELSNVVERLVILCDEPRVGQAHLRESLAAPCAGADAAVPQAAQELVEARRKLRHLAGTDVERKFLLEALRRNGYNVTRAAAQTGMQRSNFQALLRKHGLRIRDLAGRQGLSPAQPEDEGG